MVKLGLTLSKLKKFEDAIIVLDQAIDLDPQNIELYNTKGENMIVTLGLIFSETQRFNLAKDNFDYAIKLDPKFVKSYNSKGILFFLLNQQSLT